MADTSNQTDLSLNSRTVLTRSAAWLRAYAFPLQVFAVSRLVLLIIAYCSVVLLPVRTEGVPPRMLPENAFLDGWVRWDSAWYGSIATNGYRGVPAPTEIFDRRDIVFFPLYPLLMRLGSAVTGNVYTAGMVISNTSFLIALLLVYRLVQLEYGHEVSRRTVVLLAVSPFSFFFSAVYTEALFLLAAVGMFYFGHSRRWALAALCAAIGGATRLQGVMLVVGLAILYMEQIDFRWRSIRRNVLWIPLALAGTTSYFLFLWTRFQYTPLDYYDFQNRGWGHDRWLQNLISFFQGLSVERLIAGSVNPIDVIHVALIAIAIGLGSYLILRHRVSHGVWVLLSAFMSLPSFHSFGRYVLVLFPLFTATGILLRNRHGYSAVVYISLALQTLLTVIFATSHWVA